MAGGTLSANCKLIALVSLSPSLPFPIEVVGVSTIEDYIERYERQALQVGDSALDDRHKRRDFFRIEQFKTRHVSLRRF